MFSRKKGGVKNLPAKMSVCLSHTLFSLKTALFIGMLQVPDLFAHKKYVYFKHEFLGLTEIW